MKFSHTSPAIRTNILTLVTVATLIVSLFPAATFAQQLNDVSPSNCKISENLLANGSFETPTIGASADGWDVFDSVVNGLVWSVSWVNPTVGSPAVAKLELQGGMYKASADAQYAELDSNWYPSPGALFKTEGEDARVKIEQTVSTLIGVKYTLQYDFSPLPHTDAANNLLKVYVNGVELNSHTADGSTASTTAWSNHDLTFIASSTETTIAFADNGTADTFGTLLDNISLTTCTPTTSVDTYKLFGNVWEDSDADNVIDENEGHLEGWTVRAMNASNTEEVYTAVSDISGHYEINVPAGTWILSERTQTGWTLLSTGDGKGTIGTYTTTLPVVPPEEVTFMNWLIPTALAASQGEAGPFNFGNDQINTNTNGGGGSNSSHRRTTSGSSSTNPTGQVLGVTTTTPSLLAGEVLGDATSTLPVGAPNTGAGGTSPLVINFGLSPIILGARMTVRKAK